MKPTNTKFLIIFHVYFAAYALFLSHFFEADEVFFLGMILGLSIFFFVDTLYHYTRFLSKKYYPRKELDSA